MAGDIVRCDDCGRRLSDPRYVARGTGRVCGGVIRSTGWRWSGPVRIAAEVDDAQLELDLAGVTG